MASPTSVPISPETSLESPHLAATNTVTQDFANPSQNTPPKLPSLRNAPDGLLAGNTTTSTNPLGAVNAARRPAMPQSTMSGARGGGLPQDMQAKMKAFHLSRQGAPPPQTLRMPSGTPVNTSSAAQLPASAGPVPNGAAGSMPPTNLMSPPAGPMVGGVPANFRLPPSSRPPPANFNSAPAVPGLNLNPKMGLAAKRGLNRGMKLADATGPASPTSNTTSQGSEQPNGTQNKSSGNSGQIADGGSSTSLFSKYSEFVDTKTGTLKFKGKATIHGKGIDFSSGSSFNISLDEIDNLDELGKGNYGTVYKVRHSRPQMRKPGQGLGGIKSAAKDDPDECTTPTTAPGTGNTTGLVMAMKEIRLELDEAKFAAIIMELDILHRCISPFIIDFYGAFFQEGAVYICMEYMDGGSVDKLYGDGVPEGVLRKIALSTIMGLKVLKDEHNIIHRDVKPTNILINTRGQVKICDFGVSGNLVASIAKTNIGCQSYMAPERIASGGVAQAGANPGGGTYSVQSDIWSLGLSIIECAMGQYPYPPETYDNIFSQLSVRTTSIFSSVLANITRLSLKEIRQICQMVSPTKPKISFVKVLTKSPNFDPRMHFYYVTLGLDLY